MTVTVQAPAKINLTLEILGKRDDGYHELRSIIQTVSLFDTLRFQNSEIPECHSDSKVWAGEKSLVSKAIHLFRESVGIDRNVSVSMEKRIPMMAGLGGDSSDAAATLVALNRLWDAGLSVSELHGMAQKLGSDCPFFLYGGTALLAGRGEIVTPLPPVKETSLVMVIPDLDLLPGKTGRLFAGLHSGLFSDGRETERYAAGLHKGGSLPRIVNTFEQVAYTVFEGLDGVRKSVKEITGGEVHLAGSGPVLFTVVPDESVAEDLTVVLTEHGFRAISAGTCDGMIVA